MTAYESATMRLAPDQEACALIQDLLPLYIDGEVSPGSREVIEGHVQRCERCAGFMAGARSVRAYLQRERLQREAARERDQPTIQTAATGRRVVLLAVLGFIVAGALLGGSWLSLIAESGMRMALLLAPLAAVVAIAIIFGSRPAAGESRHRSGAPAIIASIVTGIVAMATLVVLAAVRVGAAGGPPTVEIAPAPPAHAVVTEAAPLAPTISPPGGP